MHNFLKFFNIPHFHWKQKSLFIDFMCLHLSLTRWSPKLGSWIVAQKKRWTRQINKIPNSIFQPFSFFGSFSCFDAHLRDWSEKVSSSSGASKWGEGEEMKIKELFFEEMKKTNKKVFLLCSQAKTEWMKIELLSYRLLRCRFLPSMWLHNGGNPFSLARSSPQLLFSNQLLLYFLNRKEFSPFSFSFISMQIRRKPARGCLKSET